MPQAENQEILRAFLSSKICGQVGGRHIKKIKFVSISADVILKFGHVNVGQVKSEVMRRTYK